MADKPVSPAPAQSKPAPTPQPAKPAAKPAAKPVVKAPDKPVEKVKKAVDKNMRTLYILIIILGVVALGLVSFIVYSEVILKEEPRANDQQEELSEDDEDEMADVEEEDDDEGEEESSEEESSEGDSESQYENASAFIGDYLEATLPTDWSIVEYENGAGSDMISTGTYVGLTGFEVRNPDDDMVFKMKAVHGIGGVASCEDYFKFTDDNSVYYNQVVSDSAVHGVTPVIVDYTSTSYTSFTFLGLDVRRIGKKLFWDSETGATYFEAACDLSYSVWNLTGVSFTADGSASSAYMWEIDSTTTDAELLKMDDILDGMDDV